MKTGVFRGKGSTKLSFQHMKETGLRNFLPLEGYRNTCHLDSRGQPNIAVIRISPTLGSWKIHGWNGGETFSPWFHMVLRTRVRMSLHGDSENAIVRSLKLGVLWRSVSNEISVKGRSIQGVEPAWERVAGIPDFHWCWYYEDF